jgi:hypothetical protein
MASPKFALVVDGVVDVISYDPDRDEEGIVLPQWIEVADEVFAGFIDNEDGSFSAPEPIVLEPPSPVEVEPIRIACALRVPVVDGEVQQIGGAYRVMAMFLMDEGVFLAIFSQDLGAEPYVIPNNGISVAITEWGGDYAVLKVRDHAGGTLVTPTSFGFFLYQL